LIRCTSSRSLHELALGRRDLDQVAAELADLGADRTELGRAATSTRLASRQDLTSRRR
jgi:hypothetical protein